MWVSSPRKLACSKLQRGGGRGSRVHSPGRRICGCTFSVQQQKTWKEGTTLEADGAGFQPPTPDVHRCQIFRFSTAVQTNEIPSLAHHCRQVGESGEGDLWSRCCGSYLGLEGSRRRRQASVEHRTDSLLDRDLFQLRKKIQDWQRGAEAQLLRCSCRFTWVQSELSFIIMAPRPRTRAGAELTWQRRRPPSSPGEAAGKDGRR